VLECVPNVSEGRRQDVIDGCARAISLAANLLDVTADPAHNRSVFTFAGEADALHAAVMALFEHAVATIDLRRHHGEHPRVGAVDVVPFVPFAGGTMHVAADLARKVARDVGTRFSIPVYLYEDASPPGRRRRLEQIRRGGLEGLAERMASADWTPDFGPDTPHASAGVSVVGARPVLIAFNVELGSANRDHAAGIARAVRESSGGLPAVKAIAVTLAERGTVQVSMNLTDFARTSIVDAFDAVAKEAGRIGVSIVRSELIGLAPQAALTREIADHVKLLDFDEDRMILERRLAAGRRPVSG
jgi:glutamate formiminotransferase